MAEQTITQMDVIQLQYFHWRYNQIDNTYSIKNYMLRCRCLDTNKFGSNGRLYLPENEMKTRSIRKLRVLQHPFRVLDDRI